MRPRPTVSLLALLALTAGLLSTDAPADDEVDLSGLAEADRERLEPILDDPSLVIPLGEERVEATIEIYEFLLARLDFTAAIVRRFRLGSYRIDRMGESTFHVDDSDGAVADIRLVHEEPHGESGTRRLYLAVGFFEILRGVRVYGDGVIVLDYEPDGDGRLRTDARILFRLKNETLDKLSRIGQRALRAVVRSKAALFVEAAREASELVAADAERVDRRMQGTGVRAEDLDLFRKTFVEDR